MTISLRKAGAIGAAAVCLTAFAGAETTGAFAQAPKASQIEIIEDQPVQDDQPTFVSAAVVQVLSEAQIAADKAAQAEAEAKAAAEAETAAKAKDAGSLRELVRKMDTPTSLSEQMRCLASAIYFEARGEPLDGQLAVAKVIMNRAASRTFPSSYCGVVKQRSQFSFVRGGRIPTPNKGTNAWKRAKAIAFIADQGMWDSPAKDSLYFHATYVRPGWARKKSQRAQINTHIFYR